eukprot:1072977-Pyramimonas_sp.AAC.1
MLKGAAHFVIDVAKADKLSGHSLRLNDSHGLGGSTVQSVSMCPGPRVLRPRMGIWGQCWFPPQTMNT